MVDKKDYLIESIAEDYICDLDISELQNISEEGVDIDILKDWISSEYPDVEFTEEDIECLNNELINSADWYLQEARQTAKDDLEKDILASIEENSDSLENIDIASVLVNVASTYLN